MAPQALKPSQRIHGFNVKRVEEIPELRSLAVLCIHEKTGARLMHLRNDDPNNLFCIAFRTPVFNNTGVAHILEHSVLAGSRKFPLKDPFKELLKGSLQTFLNALTYPDKTIYPVSSQVEADFYNLVDVYCDAVFHPLLRETTFMQEGWHFDAERADGPIGIKGIVYNEMKGVYSDFRSHVARRTIGGLYPDTTYAYDSGGDPEDIPSLTYEQFCEFHRRYYHPSNSYIFLYGTIPTESTLRFLDEKYLGAFHRFDADSIVRPQPLWSAPRRMAITAPSSKEDDGTASVIVSWSIGDSADPLIGLLGSILSRYLLGAESSPLKRALIDSGLGEDLDGMSGFDADLRQAMFTAGLRRTRACHADEIERLVLDTLRSDINRGLDADVLEGAIRRVEFHLREISDGGHFPYNLMLAERCFRSWLYGGDPLAHLRFEKTLEKIKREKAKGTGFFAEAIRRYFLDNTHRLLTIVEASAAMGEALGRLTERQAHELTASFDDARRNECAAITRNVLAYQKEPPSSEAIASLPRLNKKDLPKENRRVPTVMTAAAGTPVYAHPLFTGGIAYLDIGFDMEHLPPEQLAYFPLYSEVISRCGAAGLSVEQMATRVSLNTGGVACSDVCSVRPESESCLVCKALFHGKALAGRFDAMVDIFIDLFSAPALADTKLIKDTLLEMRNDFNAAILNNGHIFASSHAASRLVPSRFIVEQLDGITQLRFLERLVRQNDMEAVADSLQSLHRSIMSRAGCFMSLTADSPEMFLSALERCVSCLSIPAAGPVSFPRQEAGRPRGIEISSSVNFVGQAWPLCAAQTAHMGELKVISKCLSTGYLWEKVRVEGGAYGGKAFVDSSHPVFMCASYRDPNIAATLGHFKSALTHVASGLSANEVDQNIIGAIGVIDHPHTPHAQGIGETIALICGRTPEYRQAIRDSVLSATPRSLAECAEQILCTQQSAVTVLGSADAFDKAQAEGIELERERLMRE